VTPVATECPQYHLTGHYSSAQPVSGPQPYSHLDRQVEKSILTVISLHARGTLPWNSLLPKHWMLICIAWPVLCWVSCRST
jgi:hypothetical protein